MRPQKIRRPRLLIALTICLVLATLLAMVSYVVFFKSNVSQPKTVYIYVPSQAKYSQIEQILDTILINKGTFGQVSRLLQYPKLIKAGKYKIMPSMGNWALVRLLRSGNQTPVRLSFVKFRMLNDAVIYCSKKMEFSEQELQLAIDSNVFLNQNQLTQQAAIALFVPNTYEFYWNMRADKFVEKMVKQYLNFWTQDRRDKAAKMNLTAQQITIVASIVEEETNKADEKARVAGVYLNRLALNMKLQADPTVKYAVGDFTLRRILNIHLAYDSPYNTYFYEGLPPAPICTPSVVSLEATLNAETHDYLFFCAKEDFSGYHNFAKTFAEHNLNAQRYQSELNKRKIK